MVDDAAIDRLNMDTMRAAVPFYSSKQEFTQVEKSAVGSVIEEVRGQQILDLGVGGGRTVTALREVSDDYIGVDNVPEMVASCRRRFPGVRFEVVDARAMSIFDDNSFGLVFFGCNGLAMVGHKGRLAICKEVYRVLKPGGIFIFSTYNRESDDHSALFKFPPFDPSRNPLTLGVRLSRFFLRTAVRAKNRLKFLHQNKRTHEYSIINDECHDYATLLYYISIDKQRKQLRQMGFQADPTLFDMGGAPITNHSFDHSITYVVRK